MNTKKKKLKIKWKTAVPALICLILFIYLCVSLLVGLFTASGKDIDIYKIGNLSGKKTLEVVNHEDRQNPVMVKDYNFYGESLNFYFDTYSQTIKKSETLNGKNVILKDLLNDKNVIKFEKLTAKIDNQIRLENIPDGFYALYLQEGDTTSRLYYDSVIAYDNIIYTVRSNGSSKKVELIGDKTLFDGDKNKDVLDNNYLYLKVTTVNDDENKQYDIAISTAPALVYEGVSLEGVEENGIIEAQELYDVAQKIKTALEQKGLKVIILKDEYNQDIPFYGAGGVLNKAYSSKAKYMLHLDMDEYGNKSLLYSSYSSGLLAKSVFEDLFKDTAIYPSNEYLQTCALADDNISDLQYEIREAGGVVLAAGTYSESSQKNYSFAGNNKFGIDTIQIITTNINDSDDVAVWQQNKEKIASAIAQGICDFLNLKTE
ncbi:MAG: hypothetical protein Q4C64_05410 [Erysipelotrichia bacterium]|nr:hypothetical protein [Erysipelotrichia bacterium]